MFSQFMQLYNHLHNPMSERFHHPQKFLHAPFQSTPNTTPRSKQTLIQKFHKNGIIHYVVFHTCLLSYSLMLLQPTLYHVSAVLTSLLPNNKSSYRCTTVDGHLCGFCFVLLYVTVLWLFVHMSLCGHILSIILKGRSQVNLWFIR